jgi:hypothetical protein
MNLLTKICVTHMIEVATKHGSIDALVENTKRMILISWMLDYYNLQL